MNNKMNMGYEGEFWFGNPPQKMDVLFDTGSDLVWLFSEQCKEGNCPKKNKKYASTKSSDYHVNNKKG